MTLKQHLARGLLRLCGWRLQDGVPDSPSYVLIAAPHTSNWDFPWMLLSAWGLGLRIHWIGKHTLFKPPFNGIMRRLGGFPVRRDSGQNMVDQAVTLLRERESLILTVPPEGSRSYRPYWRSGFYHIARLAEVPIVLSYLDYGHRRCGVGPAILPSGDLRADMARIRAFYADFRGKYPDQSGPIRLREEAPLDAAPGAPDS